MSTQLLVENPIHLHTIKNLEKLPPCERLNYCRKTLIYPEALIDLIKKSKLGDTVPVATRVLHAKRAFEGRGLIDENGKAAPEEKGLLDDGSGCIRARSTYP